LKHPTHIGIVMMLCLPLAHCDRTDRSDGDVTPPRVEQPTVANVVRLDVGLDSADEQIWHHHDEGSGFLPLSFFHALEDPATERPFLESLPRFGFVPDPENAAGLPIGLSAAPLAGAPTESILVGVSCAACHSGQYTFRGTAMTIDGAPNMLDFEALLDGLTASLTSTLSSPRATLQLLHGIIRWERELSNNESWGAVHPEALNLLAEASTADDDHALRPLRDHLETTVHEAYHAEHEKAAGHSLKNGAAYLKNLGLEKSGAGNAWHHLRDALPTFSNDLAFIRRRAERLVTLQKAFSNETEGGPGRADSFDAIWDLLVQQDGVIPMTAPVSIPHLFEYADFHWVHWDGNTTSVMERDYAQAIALGADHIPETLSSTVLPQNVIELEHTARKLKAPVWPTEILGEIDESQAELGQQLFAQHCLSCHEKESLTPVDEIGTDPLRAVNFATLSLDGKSYAQILSEVGGAVAKKSLSDHAVSADDMSLIARSTAPEWRNTRAYQSRPLAGIWASPPYLHNGSVPTLWDLLQRPADRPREFAVGRELDEKKVGIDITRQGEGAWLFQADQTGNDNAGHNYGTGLSDNEKWSLVEYMKTL